MRSYIVLFVNGQEHRVSGTDAFLTLSDFLRRRLGLRGTKIVCSEGDCGSCSVLCGRLESTNRNADGGLTYLPIDSCIRFVFQLDGTHIVTVEGLQQDGQITGVQQAMIDCHGSQCGFCTPGFVVAMTGILEDNDSPSRQQWCHGLTGNLCRCTGYSPILDAASHCHPENTPRMNRCYPPAKLIEQFQAGDEDEILIEAENHGERLAVYCPVSVWQATSYLAEHPDAKMIAGATDMGVQFNKGSCSAKSWLDLNRVAELAGVEIANDQLVAGARATWAEIESVTLERIPQFHEIVAVFGSPQIRNVGTLGGNIINASPIADSIPFLYVCDAELELASRDGTRTVNINNFYHGYKKFDLQPGELLTGIRVPLPAASTQLQLYKVSRRKDLDISSFTAAIRVELNRDQITEARIAYGAVGPVVLRLPRTESFLTGQTMSAELFQAAGDIAVSEITPISDVRGGVDYRHQLAKNVLRKFYYETTEVGASV